MFRMLEPEEINEKARCICYDYFALLGVAANILRSIPRYQKTIITDESSGKQYTGVIKRVIDWEVEFIEDSTHNCYLFSVKNLDLSRICYFDEDQDVQIFINHFDKQKERKDNAK